MTFQKRHCIFLFLLKHLWILFVVFLQLSPAIAQEDSVYHVLQKSLDSTREDTRKIELLNRISNLLLHHHPAQSLLYARKARDIAQEIQHPAQLHTSLLHIAQVYYLYERYSEALGYLHQALKIAQGLENAELIIETLDKIIHAYKAEKNISKAFKYISKAIHLAKTEKNTDALIRLYLHQGEIYLQAKEYVKAKKYILQAIKLGTQQNIPNQVALAHFEMATLYQIQHQYTEALPHVQMAYDYFQAQTQPEVLANIYVLLGNSYAGLQKEQKSLEYFQKGIHLADSLKEWKVLGNIYEQMAFFAEKHHKPEEALQYYKLFKNYNDSIHTKEKEVQLAKIQRFIEFDRNKQTIKNLIRDKETKEKQVKTQTFLRNAFIGAFLVIFILAFVLYQKNTQQYRINSLLKTQKEEILVHQRNIEDKNKMLELQNYEIGEQHAEIEAQNQDIKDSIEYAQRIQSALLPTEDKIRKVFPEHFILFKPRDIVSGDFYWFWEKEDKFFVSAVDCTGHGVPGAFMSLIGHELLNDIIIERAIHSPDLILSELHQRIRLALNQAESQNRDGMDMALCVIHKKEKKLEFAGAYNPLVFIQNSDMNLIQGNNNPIGGWHSKGETRSFTKHTISLNTPTMLYLYSDGYQDQFGGKKGRKLMKSRFKKLLFEIHAQPMQEQKEVLNNTIKNWMHERPEGKPPHEQVDDILIIGIRLDFSNT